MLDKAWILVSAVDSCTELYIHWWGFELKGSNLRSKIYDYIYQIIVKNE